MFRLDLYNFHQAANDFPTGQHVGLAQPLPDLLRELVHVAEHQPKFGLLGGVVHRRCRFFLQSFDPLLGMLYARLKFCFLQQTGLVGIDQATDAASRGGDLLGDLHDVHVRLLFPVQTTLEFLLEIGRVLEHCADIGPHFGFHPIHANGLVRADSTATIAMTIGSEAAVVGIEDLVATADEAGHPVAIVGISAASAFQEPLEHVHRAGFPLPAVLAVLNQLFGHGVKRIFADKGGDRDYELIFGLALVSRLEFTRMLRYSRHR